MIGPTLTHNQIAALEALAEHVDRRVGVISPQPRVGASTFAWPRDVASTSELTEREIREALNQLYRLGLVHRERKHRGGHRFRITKAGWDILDGVVIPG